MPRRFNRSIKRKLSKKTKRGGSRKKSMNKKRKSFLKRKRKNNTKKKILKKRKHVLRGGTNSTENLAHELHESEFDTVEKFEQLYDDITDLDNGNGTITTDEDNHKIVINLRKTFYDMIKNTIRNNNINNIDNIDNIKSILDLLEKFYEYTNGREFLTRNWDDKQNIQFNTFKDEYLLINKRLVNKKDPQHLNKVIQCIEILMRDDYKDILTIETAGLS